MDDLFDRSLVSSDARISKAAKSVEGRRILELRNERAVSTLIHQLDDPDDSLRQSTRWTLVRMNCVDAIAPLGELLRRATAREDLDEVRNIFFRTRE